MARARANRARGPDFPPPSPDVGSSGFSHRVSLRLGASDALQLSSTHSRSGCELRRHQIGRLLVKHEVQYIVGLGCGDLVLF